MCNKVEADVTPLKEPERPGLSQWQEWWPLKGLEVCVLFSHCAVCSLSRGAGSWWSLSTLAAVQLRPVSSSSLCPELKAIKLRRIVPVLGVTPETLASSCNVRKIIASKPLIYRFQWVVLSVCVAVVVPLPLWGSVSPPFILMGSTRALPGYLQYKILKLHVVFGAGSSRWTFFCICCVQTWLCTLFLGERKSFFSASWFLFLWSS